MTRVTPVSLPEPLAVTRAKLARSEDRLRRYRTLLVALQDAERSAVHLGEAVAETYGVTVKLALAAMTATDLDPLALVTRAELRGIELAIADRLPAAKEASRNLRGGLMVAINTERTNRARLRRRILAREGVHA